MSAPQRIQLRRTKGWRMPEGTFKVDRSTLCGNPFRPIDPSNPEHIRMAVEYFRKWVTGEKCALEIGNDAGVIMAFIPEHDRPERIRNYVKRLKGCNVGCWCPVGSPCHGDVILELMEQKEEVQP